MKQYSTRSTTDVKSKLKSLESRARTNGVVIDRMVYKLMCDPQLLEIAYNNIRSRPGNMTPGVTPETLDGMSYDLLLTIAEQLKTERFQFKPGRRIYIPKPGKKLKRPLTIAPPRDKVVQEAMRIILNCIFEPTFLDSSHGFRPHRSCHTALERVKIKFKPATWVIEGDIEKCFDSVNHERLMEIIEAKITDRQFTKLIRKSLKAGYFEFQLIPHNIIGTPQGSIISPILSNIYLHQMDAYLEELKNAFDKGKRAKNTLAYERIRYQMKKAKGLPDKSGFRTIVKEARKTPVMDYSDPAYKRLGYVRYADDWVVGIRGSYLDAREILSKISEFCQKDLKLKVSDTKTKITNLNKEKVVFLGVNIFRSKHTKYYRRKRSSVSSSYKQGQNLQLQFHVSLDRIRSRLAQANIYKTNQKAHPKFIWLSLEHSQIVTLYNGVLRGFLNYYSFVGNYSRLVSLLRYVIYGSATALLATKYNLTMAKVIKKFGRTLKDPTNQKHQLYEPTYKATGEFKINANPLVSSLYSRHRSLASLQDLVCSICGSDYRVEMHHVRALKDLNPKASAVDQIMAKNRRKQIPLCRECHMTKHRNETKMRWRAV